MSHRLNQVQKELLADLMNGSHIIPFRTQVAQTSSGKLVTKKSLDALIREKCVKQELVEPLQAGARKPVAWVFCQPTDERAGEAVNGYGGTPEDAAASEKKRAERIESLTNKFVAVSNTVDRTLRRQQIESLVKLIVNGDA